jgi:hypothetical protein
MFYAICINTYYRWTIKARVTNKSDIRRWSNAKGEGTLFSIDLLDEGGGEIRGTFFKGVFTCYRIKILLCNVVNVIWHAIEFILCSKYL